MTDTPGISGENGGVGESPVVDDEIVVTSEQRVNTYEKLGELCDIIFEVVFEINRSKIYYKDKN